MILTNVDAVFEGWGTPAARPLRRMTVAAGRGADGAAAALDEGGMKPKVEAAAGFARRHGRPRHHRPAERRSGGAARRDRNDHHEGAVNIHEYQARALLKAAGIPMLDGDVASTPDRGRGDRAAARRHRRHQGAGARRRPRQGGRREAGAKPRPRRPTTRPQILGMKIKGLTVQKVLVVPAADIATESYVGLIMDRETQQPVFMVSPRGRHRHRGGRGQDAGEDPPAAGRSHATACFPHQALELAFVLYRDFDAGARPRRRSWSSSTRRS